MSYSPTALARVSEFIPGNAFIVASVACQPEELDQVVKVVLDLGDELARGGVEADEVARAKQPILTILRNIDFIEKGSRLHAHPNASTELDRERSFYEEAAPHSLPPAVRIQLKRERASVAIVRPKR